MSVDKPIDAAKKKTTTTSKPDKKVPKPSTRRKKTATSTKQLDDLKKRISELEDKILRLRAEYNNYRRRKSSEVLKLMEYEGENIFRAILPIIDDLDRMQANFSTDAEKSEKVMQTGITMITNKFQKIITEYGVEAFDSIGEILDADLHDAMMVIQNADKEQNEILQEHEKGYKYKDRVLRHAKVIVNKK